MKDFNDFRKYMKSNGNRISAEVQSKTEEFISKNQVGDIITVSNAYTQIAIMKMLEEYHNWLNSES